MHLHMQSKLEEAFESQKVAADAKIARLESQNRFLIKRVAALTDQMGHLTESILRRVRYPESVNANFQRSVFTCKLMNRSCTTRQSVQEMHGQDAAARLDVSSLQGLCSLLLPRDARVWARIESSRVRF